MSREVTFALGSNLGDRKKNLLVALDLLDEKMGCVHKATSAFLKTEALGFAGSEFLNCLVLYDSDKDPFEMLEICKCVERMMGRTDPPEYDISGKRIYHDRIIDIDILTVGQETVNTEKLQIPHPQLFTRPYITELLLTLQV